MYGREAKKPREKAVYHRGMVSAAHARRAGTSRAKRWIAIAIVAVVAAAVWFQAGTVRDLFGRQYEYEEDLTVGIDGAGTLTINASLAALAALRGRAVDPQAATVDRERIRALYQSPAVRVVSVPRPWNRHGRQFVQVNLAFDDVTRLHEAAPLSWSRYEMKAQGGQHVFRQAVGASALELRRKAIEEGMITLRGSGLRKVTEGVTTIEEVLRETVK
jgi:hypothetical protein